jgi:hypothetical protein
LQTLTEGWIPLCPHYPNRGTRGEPSKLPYQNYRKEVEKSKLDITFLDPQLPERSEESCGLMDGWEKPHSVEVKSTTFPSKWNKQRTVRRDINKATFSKKKEANRPRYKRQQAVIDGCHCHPGHWTCDYDVKHIRIKSSTYHNSKIESKLPDTGYYRKLVKPPDKGGTRREILYHIGKRKIIKSDRNLCQFLQLHLIGVCIKVETLPFLLIPYCREKKGWVMITKVIPFRLIRQVLGIISSVPNTASRIIFSRLIDEISSITRTGNMYPHVLP